MVRAEMLEIKMIVPHSLGTIAGRDISKLIIREKEPFFDGGAQVRIGVFGARDVAYMPVIDVIRIMGASNGTADRDSKPDKLVAAGICTYRDSAAHRHGEDRET